MSTSTKDIAWAAGIYEGEGNFQGNTVKIIQKDTWILKRLQYIFQFGSINTHGPACYNWCASGQNARQFLLTIFTFLSPRRKAEIIEHKQFFIDSQFKQQRVCRNGHIKTAANTRRKYNHHRREFDTVCTDCQKARSKKYWSERKGSEIMAGRI